MAIFLLFLCATVTIVLAVALGLRWVVGADMWEEKSHFLAMTERLRSYAKPAAQASLAPTLVERRRYARAASLDLVPTLDLVLSQRR